MFIVLIGSVARKDYNSNSDIDICRINLKRSITRRELWPQGPINYIDYNKEVFNHLYKTGSLFIYHILNEGILLNGNMKIWERYKTNFKVQSDFSREITKLVDTTYVFKDLDIFGNTFLSLYSNLYNIVKNFAIFYLANNKKYLFNKQLAMDAVFLKKTYNRILIDSNNYFERGNTTEKWDYNCKKTAQNVLDYYICRMKELNK
jgi:predicted nucleotidyltransferase